MLHAKFQDLRTSGSEEEDFGHVIWIIYINVCSPLPRRLHMKFGFDWPSGFGGEEV